MSLPSWPRDIQRTVSACCSISGNVSSWIAATTISIPWLRAASSTRKGNFPFPAIKPYLFDDATRRCLDKFQENLNLRRSDFIADVLHGLSGVELRLQQEPESR